MCSSERFLVPRIMKTITVGRSFSCKAPNNYRTAFQLLFGTEAQSQSLSLSRKLVYLANILMRLHHAYFVFLFFSILFCVSCYALLKFWCFDHWLNFSACLFSLLSVVSQLHTKFWLVDSPGLPHVKYIPVGLLCSAFDRYSVACQRSLCAALWHLGMVYVWWCCGCAGCDNIGLHWVYEQLCQTK